MPLFTTRIRVPWVDTDAAGVVHFSNYFRYCERLEEEFLNAIGLPFGSFRHLGVWLPRVHASCRYRWPLRFNQTARLELVDLELGRRHIRYRIAIYNEDEGRLSAECEIVVVSASREKGEAVELPGDLVRRIEEYLEKARASSASGV